MALADLEKTEAPTPRRREEARREGKIPRSAELTTALALIAAALVIKVGSGPASMGLAGIMRDNLIALGEPVQGADGMLGLLRSNGWKTLAIAAAWCGALGVIVALSAALQARGVISAKPLTPDFKRMSPAQNVRRIVGSQTLVELVKSLLKLAIVSFAVYKSLGTAWADAVALTQTPVGMLAVVLKTHVVRLLLTAGGCYLALAAFDYGWQLWKHEQSLRMSREELKQELKQSEGDPLVKQRMRSLGRALARRNMLRAVPRADVVITNPTHLAVALQYDPDLAPAPLVLAIGQRKVAERIKQIARENGVPCIENKPLARALVAGARVGRMIPAELYAAVAEILAFVIRRRLKRSTPLAEVYA
ncbi:MAG: EscU/YscU/HrcU family type III secretion system export apparatus switch protein [Gemmatimonadota bacterium]